jgi:SAM-dependent methyltransferase
MAEDPFDARRYWEERLADDYSLTGVGFRRLGPSFNRWAYQVRQARFQDAVDRLELDPASSRVVDIGSGTGFYVDHWLQLGATVTGLDLTETAVDHLRSAYPAATFVRADIGDPAVVEQVGAGTVDAVSAMDVLFHVVDDAAYATALANIRDLLRPGGYLLYSDAFVHGPTQRVEHRVSRSLSDVTEVMRHVGLEVVDRRPFFWLMNDPQDSRNPVYKGLWYAAAALISTSDRIGDLAGRRLYPLELKLTTERSESPSTELMVCRRP